MTLIVNYIWMHKKHDECTRIPEKCFAAFQQNAFQYSNVTFCLWVEDRAAHEGYMIPSNVLLCCLDGLDSYKENKGLINLEPFEVKVDLVRLFVLQKTIQENQYATAVYADFDILDLCLNSDDFKDRIDKYGMAISGSYYPAIIKNTKKILGLYEKTETIPFGKNLEKRFLVNPERDVMTMKREQGNFLIRTTYLEYGKVLTSHYENGFLAFTQDTAVFVDTMISRALANIEKAEIIGDPRDMVYFTMSQVFDEWDRKKLDTNGAETLVSWQQKIASFYVQYSSGWKLDDISTLIPQTKS